MIAHDSAHTNPVSITEWGCWVLLWVLFFTSLVLAFAPADHSAMWPGVLGLGGLGGLMYVLHAHSTRWGWASRVTMMRALITLSLASFLWWPEAYQAHGLGLGMLGLMALLADGLDGYLARRLNETSLAGARFDMETDAALMLVLSVAVWWMDRAGAWVLAIGGMRYAFVAASYALPWMRGSLPDSLRRKVICVVQVSVLLAVLPPWFSDLQATALLGFSLALLVYSFTVDTLMLWQHRFTTTDQQT